MSNVFGMIVPTGWTGEQTASLAVFGRGSCSRALSGCQLLAAVEGIHRTLDERGRTPAGRSELLRVRSVSAWLGGTAASQ